MSTQIGKRRFESWARCREFSGSSISGFDQVGLTRTWNDLHSARIFTLFWYPLSFRFFCHSFEDTRTFVALWEIKRLGCSNSVCIWHLNLQFLRRPVRFTARLPSDWIAFRYLNPHRSFGTFLSIFRAEIASYGHFEVSRSIVVNEDILVLWPAFMDDTRAESFSSGDHNHPKFADM